MVSSPVENIIQRYLWLDYRWNWVSNIHDRFHEPAELQLSTGGMRFDVLKRRESRFLANARRLRADMILYATRERSRAGWETRRPPCRVYSAVEFARGNKREAGQEFPSVPGKGLAAIDSHELGGTCLNLALRTRAPTVAKLSVFRLLQNFACRCVRTAQPAKRKTTNRKHSGRTRRYIVCRAKAFCSLPHLLNSSYRVEMKEKKLTRSLYADRVGSFWRRRGRRPCRTWN